MRKDSRVVTPASPEASNEFSIKQAPIGAHLHLVRVDAGTETCRILTALGLRRGCRFTIDRKTAGGGRVVRIGGARVALGIDVLDALITCPVEQAA